MPLQSIVFFLVVVHSGGCVTDFTLGTLVSTNQSHVEYLLFLESEAPTFYGVNKLSSRVDPTHLLQ